MLKLPTPHELIKMTKARNRLFASMVKLAQEIPLTLGAGLRETIERQVQTLKVKGRLREQDGLFRLGIVT
jgi:hypothetical protein